MKTIEDIKNSIPEFARDIQENFSLIIMNSSYDDKLIYGCAYACSLSVGSKRFSKIFKNECQNKVSKDFVKSIRSTVSIMSLYNIWYSYRDLMPSIDMKVSSKKMKISVLDTYAGLDKILFESIALCISSIKGYKFCIKSHSQLLLDSNQTKDYILNIGRIASVIKAAITSIDIKN